MSTISHIIASIQAYESVLEKVEQLLSRTFPSPEEWIRSDALLRNLQELGDRTESIAKQFLAHTGKSVSVKQELFSFLAAEIGLSVEEKEALIRLRRLRDVLAHDYEEIEALRIVQETTPEKVVILRRFVAAVQTYIVSQ